jgi:hypothetical protein
MNEQVHPIFRQALNDFSRGYADGNRSFSAYERTYPEAVAVACTEYAKCWACDKSHPADDLVATVDGGMCTECLSMERSELEAELREQADYSDNPAIHAANLRARKEAIADEAREQYFGLHDRRGE